LTFKVGRRLEEGTTEVAQGTGSAGGSHRSGAGGQTFARVSCCVHDHENVRFAGGLLMPVTALSGSMDVRALRTRGDPIVARPPGETPVMTGIGLRTRTVMTTDASELASEKAPF